MYLQHCHMHGMCRQNTMPNQPNLTSFLTVSYTHLDVYKRQVIGFLIRESGDMFLVGMPDEITVGDKSSQPHCTLFLFAFAYHFHDPGFVGIGNGERLAAGGISVPSNQVGHYFNSLAACF